MAFRDNTRFKRNKDEDEERQYDTVFSSHKTTSRFRKSYNDAKRDGGLNTEDRERKISPYTHHESYNPYDMALETARNYTQPTTNNVTSANFYDDLTDKDKINLSESKYDLGVVPQALLQFPGGYSIPTMEALTPKKENLLSQREDLWNQETDKINDFYNNISNIGQNEVKNPSEIDMDLFFNNVSNIGQSENKELEELDLDVWKEVLNNSGNQKDNGNWYEQLKDVDKALDTVKYYEDLNKYYSIPEAEDFEEYSKYTGASAFPTSEAQKVAKALNDGSFNAPLSEYKFATDDEVAVFNYLLNKEGEEAAMDFYNKLNLTGRRTQEYTNNVKEFLTRDDGALLNTGKRTLGGLLSIPLGIVGGAVGTTANVGSYLTGNDIDINSDSNLATNIANAMREGSITGAVNDLDNWGVSEGISDFLNSAGQSLAASYGIQNKSVLGAVTGNNDVADELIDASKDIEFTTPEGVSQKIGEGLDLLYSTVNSALNIVFAGHAATITMGLSAANDTIIDAKERGLTDGQAIALGTLAGAIEVATEKYSVEALLDGDVRGWQAIKQNFLTEASEEGASAFLNEAIDLAISGDKAQRRVLYEQYLKEGYSENEALAMTLGSTLMDIMKQSAAGGISGALMSGGMEAYRYINESSTGNKMLSNEEGINTFVNLGLQSENEQTRELAQSVADGNKKKNIIGQLVQAVSSENNVVGNIVDKLIGSGETVAMAEAEAKAIMKEFYKEDLTAKEREYINKENVQNVLNDLYSGTYDKLNEKSVTADDAYSRALELAKQNKKNPVANVVNTVKGVFNKNATETTENATETENNSQNEENNSQNEKSEEDNIRDAIRHMPLSQKGKAIAEADAYNKSIKQVNATLNDVKAVEVTPDGLSVTLNDGQKVNTHQIMEDATRKLLEVAERNFGDTQGAEDFIKAYKENTNLPVFVNAAYQMINAGSNGENITEAVNSVKNDASFRVNGKNIPVSFLNNMYAYGVREQARISEAMNSKKQRTVTDFVIKGLDLENLIKEGGIEEQGSYNEKTNEITFGEKTEQSRIETLAHELTHMMKQHARDTYNELEKVVLDSFRENGVYNQIFDHVKGIYGEDATTELVNEEIVASAMQEMLFNENVINELCKEKPTLARKILNAIRKAIEELRNVFNGKIGTAESKMLSQDIEALEKAEKLYAQGLKEATANVNENGGKNTDENGTIKYRKKPSRPTFFQYKDRSQVVNFNDFGFTNAEEKDLWNLMYKDDTGRGISLKGSIGNIEYLGKYYAYEIDDFERVDYRILKEFNTEEEAERYAKEKINENKNKAYTESEGIYRHANKVKSAGRKSAGHGGDDSDGRADRSAYGLDSSKQGRVDGRLEEQINNSSNKYSSGKRAVGPKKDNKGDRLSEGQREYFANVDNELKDSNGNLKRYYHGTETPGFSVFKPSNRKGFTDNYNAIYLTDNENVAKTYTKEKDGVYPLYVKAENPYVVDAKGQTFHNWKVDNYAKRYTDIQLEASSEGHRFAYWHEDGDRKRSYGDFTIEELVDKFGEKIGIFDFADDTHIGVIYLDENGNNIPTSTDDCILHAKNNGYDSVVFNNIRDMGRFAEDYETSQVVAVFNPNQVKDIYNLTPTESKTIHFSKKGKNNIKFSYAGINAIGADMASLTEAINMLEEGKSKEDVFRETGWFQGADKKWRFEISDDAMKVFPKGDAKYLNDKEYQRYQEIEKTFFYGDPSTLSKEELKEFDDLYNKFLNRKSLRVDDVIQHDKLFEAYPFLRKIQIEFVKPETMNGASGRFNATEGKIYVDLYEKARLNDLKSTIIHELQHAIQNWSGYAGGASAEMYAGINSVIDSYYYEEYKDSDAAIKRLLNKAPEEFKEKYNKISESYLMYRTTQDEKYINEAHKLEEDLEANYKKLYDDLSELEAEKKFYEDLLEEEITPEKLYWITAGEIEARDTASRINLTEEERREKYPKRTEKHKVYIKETGEYFDDRGIRYSKKDNTGARLTEKQQKFFEGVSSELRDENGSLKRYYHGTPSSGFTVFENADDGISYFFTDNKNIAKSYSGVDYFENPDTPMSIDKLNEALWYFTGTSDEDGLFKENNGKIEYWELEGGELTKQKTYDSLKEAQAWVTDEYLSDAVSQGTASPSNYEVYLNAKNPYVYDARGNEWNDLKPVNFKRHFEDVEIIPVDDNKYEVDYKEKGKYYHKEYTEAELDNIFGDGTGTIATIKFNSGDQYSEGNIYIGADGKVIPSNTRTLSTYAKENGYDSLVINNVHDTGSYGGTDEASQVVVVFKSNQIKSVYNENPTKSDDIRYSIKDNHGRQLSEGQIEYFKDSKVRDENGSLIELYHGTGAEFTVFDLNEARDTEDIEAFFFSGNKEEAEGYGNIRKFYLNLKNPADYDTAYDIFFSFKGQAGAGAKTREELIKRGYDGVIAYDEDSPEYTEYLAFYPEQIKLTSNLNPTKNEDIRYSLQDDWDFDWEAAMAESEEEKIAEGMVAQNDVNILEDGFRALKDIKNAGKVNISHNKAVQIAKRYTEKYDSATGAESLATSIEAVFAYIREHDVSYDDMLRVMRDVTLPVVENIRGDEQFTEEYRDFVKSLKGTSISLNESQKKEVAYAYGSMANFRKAVAGRFNIKEDGVNIDSLWPEIVEQSGYRLDEEENSNSQPIALLELLDQMKSDKGTVNRGMSDNQLALDMALNIYTDCFKEMSMNAAKVNEIEVAKRLAETKEILKDTVAKYEDAVDKMYKQMLADTKARAQAEIDRLNQELRELNNIDTYNRSIDIDKRIVQLNRQKERLEKEIEEGKVRRQTSRQKARENRENSRMRNAIKRIVKDLSSRLANPTKNKYIPEELVKTTVDMLECINFDTKEGDNIKEKVKKVKDAYEKLGKSTNENEASDDYDPALYNMITRLKEIFDDGKDGKSVRKLSQKELEDVLTIAKAIQIQVKNANELIRSEIAQQLDETAKGVIDDVRATSKIGNKKFQHWLNSYVNTQLNASRFFNRLVGYNEDSKVIKLFDELNEGQHKMMQIQMETSDIFKDILTDDDEARKITGENEKDWVETPFKDKNGNPIKISKGMRLSLAMHMENEDNLKHIIYGGLTVPDMKLYNQGRRAEAYESSETEIRLIDDKTRLKLFELRDEVKNLNDEKYTNQEREEAWEKYKDVVKRAETEARQKLQSIVNGMTDYEKQFLEYAKKYFWEYSGKQINETSMALNGYPKAMVENYFPIATDKNYTKRDIEGLKLDQTLESWGNLKERVHGRNPIYLENILDVITKHSNMVSKYAGLAIPIRNFNRVYNFSLKENGAYKDSVKKAINSQRGISATKYIENLLTDLQGSRKVDTGIAGDLLSFFRGNYAAAALTMNYGVTIKQASSLPTAAAVIGKDAIKHAIISRQGASLGRTIVLPFWMSKTTKNKMDLIKKYSPLVWYRNQGNSTQELGDLKKQRTLLDFTKPTRKFKELTSNWIQNVDTTTVVTLWDAAEYRVSKDNPELKKGSEEYYKEVAKWFNKTVEDTQPNYTTLQRPDILRNPNEVVKGLSMFKTQSYQNGGLIKDSFGNMMAKEINYKNNPTAENKTKLKKAQTRFANTVAAIFTAQMLFSVMGFIALCIISKPNRYRDENGELTAESITKGIMRDFGSAISGSFLFGSEIYDGLNAIFSGGKYYGIELANLNQISTFIEDGVNLLSSGNDIEKIEKNAFKVINDVSYLAGVPLKNATNLINGVKLHAQDIINGDFFEAGYTRSNTVNQNRLYEAMISGDNDKFDDVYAEMLQNGLTPDKIYGTSGSVGMMVKEDLLAGKYDIDQAIEYLEKLGMDEESAKEKAYGFLTTGLGDMETSDKVEYLEGFGVDEDYIYDKYSSDLKKDVQDQYEDGELSSSAAQAELKKMGYSDFDAYLTVNQWETGFDSDYAGIIAAIKSEDPEKIIEAVKLYENNGFDEERLKKYSMPDIIKNEYIELYNSNKTKAASLKSAILTYYQACGMSREDAAKKVDKWVE